MIHLIGVNHTFQVRAMKHTREGGLDNYGSRHLALSFENYLNDAIDRLEPQVVGEEYGLKQLQSKLVVDDQAYLVAEKVCRTRGVKYVFCDPDQSERDELYAAHGTTEAEDAKNGFPIREQEWLKRIGKLLPTDSIIFICGADHVPSFHLKLNASNLDASIICEDFGANYGH